MRTTELRPVKIVYKVNNGEIDASWGRRAASVSLGSTTVSGASRQSINIE